jgi:hypothetical protein
MVVGYLHPGVVIDFVILSRSVRRGTLSRGGFFTSSNSEISINAFDGGSGERGKLAVHVVVRVLNEVFHFVVTAGQ